MVLQNHQQANRPTFLSLTYSSRASDYLISLVMAGDCFPLTWGPHMWMQQPADQLGTSPGTPSRDDPFWHGQRDSQHRAFFQLAPGTSLDVLDWIGLESAEIPARLYSSLSSIHIRLSPSRPSTMDSRAVSSSLRTADDSQKVAHCQLFMLPF
uniref:Uncharacterized protein n=1 Tax=Diaporthe perjuncta TaxID=186170 RepID=Q8TGV3_9PEZI|nr:unknown [Diaporthe perjuncta]